MKFKVQTKNQIEELIKSFHIKKIANEELQFEFLTTIKCNNYIKDVKTHKKHNKCILKIWK